MHGLRVFTASLLTFYAALTLCGPGHHALDGLVECVASHDGSDAQAANSSVTAAHTDQDCPICHFFSLSSLPNAFAPPTVRLAVEPAPARLDRVRPSSPLLIESSPRAPPQLGA